MSVFVGCTGNIGSCTSRPTSPRPTPSPCLRLLNNTQRAVPDDMLGDDHALRPLAEVQAFIDANSPLPDVPSEPDIKANGVDMTKMQMTLLKKVEELTLYSLELDAVRAAQAAQNRDLQTRLARVEALLGQ